MGYQSKYVRTEYFNFKIPENLLNLPNNQWIGHIDIAKVENDEVTVEFRISTNP